jgi:hypothetical protein
MSPIWAKVMVSRRIRQDQIGESGWVAGTVAVAYNVQRFLRDYRPS